jgi:hypothetical protein
MTYKYFSKGEAAQIYMIPLMLDNALSSIILFVLDNNALVGLSGHLVDESSSPLTREIYR